MTRADLLALCDPRVLAALPPASPVTAALREIADPRVLAALQGVTAPPAPRRLAAPAVLRRLGLAAAAAIPVGLATNASIQALNGLERALAEAVAAEDPAALAGLVAWDRLRQNLGPTGTEPPYLARLAGVVAEGLATPQALAGALQSRLAGTAHEASLRVSLRGVVLALSDGQSEPVLLRLAPTGLAQWHVVDVRLPLPAAYQAF